MIGLDTNVLVRVLTNDNPRQASRAAKLMQSNRVFVAKTVLLEVEWVLRHAYGLPRAAVNRSFQTLMGVTTVELEDRRAVSQAVQWHSQGMDLADALHLASGSSAASFATFDRGLARAAKKALVRQRVLFL